MLIGLRFLLLFAMLAIASTFLAFLFTKNPKFLGYTKKVLWTSATFVVLIAVIYAGERLLMLI